MEHIEKLKVKLKELKLVNIGLDIKEQFGITLLMIHHGYITIMEQLWILLLQIHFQRICNLH